MKAAVRCESLDMAGLARAEKHGKRQDWLGQQRRIRDTKPLAYGGLNLAELYAEHIEGARQNKGAKKPVLHFIIKFPPEVLTDEAPGRFAGLDRAGREAMMVRQAMAFINQSHGGRAVFAARLDRDEAGETVVDVFACPLYLKPSKSERREPALWTSATRFGEELARKHQDHIRARLKDAEAVKAITSPRAVGIALQEELAEWFEKVNGVRLTRTLKERPDKDRLEVETWRLKQVQQEAEDAAKAAEVARLDREAADADAARIRKEAEDEKADFRARAGAWVKREQKNIADTKQAADADRAAAAAELLTARTVLDRLKETYAAMRSAMPRIRQILTWDLATEDEKRRARIDRRNVVKASPFLRRIIDATERQTGRAESPSPQQSAPEPDSGPGMSL